MVWLCSSASTAFDFGGAVADACAVGGLPNRLFGTPEGEADSDLGSRLPRPRLQHWLWSQLQPWLPVAAQRALFRAQTRRRQGQGHSLSPRKHGAEASRFACRGCCCCSGLRRSTATGSSRGCVTGAQLLGRGRADSGTGGCKEDAPTPRRGALYNRRGSILRRIRRLPEPVGVSPQPRIFRLCL